MTIKTGLLEVRNKLTKQRQRASPLERAKFSQSYKMISKANSPIFIQAKLVETMFTVRRQPKFGKSKRKLFESLRLCKMTISY